MPETEHRTRPAGRRRRRLPAVALALACAGAAFTATTARAGIVLAGAPTSVSRLPATGKMPQPPVIYAFHWSSDCGDQSALGCTLLAGEVNLDPLLLKMSSARVATGLGTGVPLLSFILFHEIGHVFDHEWMTDQARAQFMGLIGRTGDWWSAGEGPPPAELFADAYALCSIYGATISRGVRYPVGYGWKPSVALEAATCRLVTGTAPVATPASPALLMR